MPVNDRVVAFAGGATGRSNVIRAIDPANLTGKDLVVKDFVGKDPVGMDLAGKNLLWLDLGRRNLARRDFIMFVEISERERIALSFN